MLTSYEVGAIFSLDPGNAVGTLETLSRGFASLGETIARAKAAGEGLAAGLTEGLTSVFEAAQRASGAVDTAASAFTSAGRAAAAGAAGVADFASAMNAAAAASERMAGLGGAAAGLGAGRAREEPAERAVPPMLVGPQQRQLEPPTIEGRAEPSDELFGPPRNEDLRLGGPGGGRPGGPGGGGTGGEAEAAAGGAAAGRGGDGVLWGLIDTAALWKSFHSALAEQQSLFLGAQAFGLDPGSAPGQAAMVRLQEAAAAAAANTSYKEFQVAAGLPLLARPFGLQGEEGVEQFSKIFPGAARAAEAVELMRLGKFEATLPAMVAYAHEAREYDPQKLAHSYDLIAAVTSLVPDTTFAAETKAMAYALPMARAAGIAPEHAAVLVGTLQQAGLQGSIAATTLRQEIVGLTRSGGPMQAHQLRGEAAEFEKALHLRDPGAAKMLRSDAHVRAMVETGLLDSKGRQTFLTTKEDAAADPTGQTREGGINVDRANAIFAHWAASHTPAQVAEAAYRLFGVRGEQAPEILSALIKSGEVDYVKRFADTVDARVATPGGFLATSRDQLSKSGAQELGQAFARLTDVATHLADTTMPMFQGALERVILPTLNLGTRLMQPGPEGYDLPQKMLGAAFVSSLVGGAAGGIGGLLTGGPPGAIAGAGVGALWGARIGIGASGAWGLFDWIQKHPALLDLQAPEFGGLPVGATLAGPRSLMGTDAEHHAGLAPSLAGPVNLTINLGGVTNNGVGDDGTFKALVDRLVSAVTRGLHDALGTSTSDAHGSSQSAFTFPGPL